MRSSILAILLLSIGFLAFGVQATEAQLLRKQYRHRRLACNQKCLRNFDYNQDRRIGHAVVLAKADEAVDGQVSVPNLLDASNTQTEAVQQKKFHIPATAIRTNRIALSKVGVTVFSNGNSICTGTVDENGGFDGGLHGNKTKITIRFYAGVQGADSIADADMVCQASSETWVFKNRPFSLNFGTKIDSSKIKTHFLRITHAELEVEHTVDK